MNILLVSFVYLILFPSIKQIVKLGIAFENRNDSIIKFFIFYVIASLKEHGCIRFFQESDSWQIDSLKDNKVIIFSSAKTNG